MLKFNICANKDAYGMYDISDFNVKFNFFCSTKEKEFKNLSILCAVVHAVSEFHNLSKIKNIIIDIYDDYANFHNLKGDTQIIKFNFKSVFIYNDILYTSTDLKELREYKLKSIVNNK